MSLESSILESSIRRILLIEDSEMDRLWLRHRLNLENIEIIEAADGLTGLDACRTHVPDLILLDLTLPYCDGYEILRILKEDRRSLGIPVIVISSASDVATKERALDLGATDFVTKPYDIVELRARIRVALRNKRHQDMLERRAHIDGLTGLSNRLALQDRLATEWGLYERYDNPLSIFMVDLDHFKRVNDRHGHVVGDEVLKRAALLLRSSIRTTDLASRFGGEEFVVVAPHCDLGGAEKTAERYRERLAMMPIVVGEQVLHVTASVGVASVPEDRVKNYVELLDHADRLLYEAKSLGRNQVRSRRMSATRPLLNGRQGH